MRFCPFFLTMLAVLGCLGVTRPAQAAETTPIDAPITETDTVSLAKQIRDAAQYKIFSANTQRQLFDSNFTDMIDDVKNYFIVEYGREKANYAKPISQVLTAIMRPLLTERVVSEFSALQSKLMLDDIRRMSISGYASVMNIDATNGTDNPNSKPEQNGLDGMVAARLKTLDPAENFIDFYLSPRTWPSQSVFDTMLVSRRFFAEAQTRINLSSGNAREKVFMDDQGIIARSNLRLAILDDLAARRAATSHATSSAMMILFSFLAPTQQISGLNYMNICKKSAPNPMERYVCSFTSAPDENGQRIISQAALDKIMQYDFVLSPQFLGEINSQADTATGPVERMEVFLKAQQVSQDYRQLRLLQMQAAVKAMNLLNNGT